MNQCWIKSNPRKRRIIENEFISIEDFLVNFFALIGISFNGIATEFNEKENLIIEKRIEEYIKKFNVIENSLKFIHRVDLGDFNLMDRVNLCAKNRYFYFNFSKNEISFSIFDHMDSFMLNKK